MTVTELALVVIAIAAVCAGVATAFIAVRVGGLARQIEPLVVDVRASLRRVDAIAGDLELVVRDARRLEGQINTVVDVPLRALGALAQGLGAGLRALARPRFDSNTPSPPRDGPGAEGMSPQSRPELREVG